MTARAPFWLTRLALRPRPRRYQRAQEGQVLVLAAAGLALLVIPLGLATWGVLQERADHATIAALVQAAAEAGAGSLAATDVAGPSATATQPDGLACVPAPDVATAAGRACQAFADGLHQHYGGTYARVQVTAALAATRVQVLDGTPLTPASDPTTQHAYHYPTVCVQAAIRVGVFAHDGLGFVQQFRSCAQMVYRP